MLGWFQALMPKEERFFDLFASHSQTLIAGAEALRGLLQGGDNVERFCKVIVDRENEADDITREVLKAVRRTFITPFDRGDIQELISRMDDAIDQMNKTAKVITLFEVREFDPSMQEMGDIIVDAAKLIVDAVPRLRTMGREAGRLNEITEQIIRLEGRADDLHDQGRKELFRQHRAGDPMSFLVKDEIYGHLEKVVDRFEDVANEISSIVIEHV
jgi:predicted phosphate transport protein (TIGR00153 family)